jgi:OTU domain-containing protein 6
MATTKQRHKQEIKELNQQSDARIQGKKGAERAAELKALDHMKRALFAQHQQELDAEAAAPAAEEPSPTADKKEDTQPKLSKARVKALKKEAKEAEEKLAREAEAKSRGPGVREREMAALVLQISALGLSIKEIPPDGNCLYSAVGHQLNFLAGETLSVPELREVAGEFMQTHQDDFEAFLPEDEPWPTYLASVRSNGVWGGQLEIRALSLALERPIWVHRVNT